jgi:hypothetical protein
MKETIKLVGLKGFSAWSVYNRVVFHLPFCSRFNTRTTDSARILSSVINSEDIDEVKAAMLTMIEGTEKVNFTPSECLIQFKAMEETERRSLLIEAANFADIKDDELMRLLAVCSDVNGIAISSSSIANYDLAEIITGAFDVLVRCSMINADLSLITKAELDALAGGRLNVGVAVNDILIAYPKASAEEVISLSIKKAINGGL